MLYHVTVTACEPSLHAIQKIHFIVLQLPNSVYRGP